MKVAVVGCGALGSFYGAKLCRAGLEVHFLLRSDYEVVSRQGVSIHGPEGIWRAQPRCARTPEEIGPSDLVVIGLKTTANDQFARLLPPLVKPATAILTLQNGLGNEEQLARLFPSEQILGGLCFVCLNRIQPGVIHHLAHGRVVLGEFGRPPEPRTRDIVSLFNAAGVSCAVTEDLARTHWEKLVWNIPFNGLGVASAAGYQAMISATDTDNPVPRRVARCQPCLTTDRLLGDSRWERLVRELMAEVIATANALGLKVSPEVAEQQIQHTLPMGPYKASTLIDFERGQPLELEALFLEPLRQAQKAGVASPRLAALCALLIGLENPGRSALSGSDPTRPEIKYFPRA